MKISINVTTKSNQQKRSKVTDDLHSAFPGQTPPGPDHWNLKDKRTAEHCSNCNKYDLCFLPFLPSIPPTLSSIHSVLSNPETHLTPNLFLFFYHLAFYLLIVPFPTVITGTSPAVCSSQKQKQPQICQKR